MIRHSSNRREFLKATAATTAGILLPYTVPGSSTFASETKSPNARPRVGCIGMGGMGSGDARAAKKYGDIVAVCDVDQLHLNKAAADPTIGNGKAQPFEDYRKLLDRKDIDVVTISTPDHWHTKILIDAMKAGKDAYCQKPLTLTIEEGKLIGQVARATGRVVQVGTQQRSENGNKFLIAVALCHAGRLGKVQRVTTAIGGGDKGGPFKKEQPPKNLNWDMWLGQTPKVEYIKERCHYQFRWWYEYSGGKLTDWGAHHVDIGQWAIGMDNSGPNTIEPVTVTHPVPFEHGYPTVDDRYNTATAFQVKCAFANGVEMLICNKIPQEASFIDDKDRDNGILIEGTKGALFVSRGKLAGKPVDELKANPLPEDALIKLRKGKRIDSHMGNFMECVRDRAAPVSDVYTHHRILTTCHLANIAMRLGRKLAWDPIAEQIVGDAEANKWQHRDKRKGYEIKA
jgi:predicted dehydrogenase